MNYKNSEHNIIAIDFETYLISEEMPIPKPVCISYAYQDGTTGLLTGSEMSEFIDWVMCSNKIVVAHHAIFEGLVILKYYPHLWAQVFKKLGDNTLKCTKIRQTIINNNTEKQVYDQSLSGLVKHYLNKDISESKTDPDAWRLRYSELEHVKLEDWPVAAKDYAIMDSVYALEVFFRQHLKHSEVIRESNHLEAGIALNWMGSKGMQVSPERINILNRELNDKTEPLYKILKKAGFYYVDKKGKLKKSNKAIHDYLIQRVPDKLHYSEKGGISTNHEALAHYASLLPNDEVIRSYIELTHYEKVKQAFMPALLKSEGVIRTQYNPIVSSGRTSSSASKSYASVNIQQLPRTVDGVTYDIRNCFEPKEGYEICSIDYNGLELSSTAHQLVIATGRTEMAEYVNRGTEPVDMHSVLAAKVMSLREKRSITYEEYLANKKDPKYKPFRQLVKPINLGFPGGIGYDTMRGLLLKAGNNTYFNILHEYEIPYPTKTGDKKQDSKNYVEWSKKFKALDNFMTTLLVNCKGSGIANIRKARLGRDKLAIVQDELVELKNSMMELYPDLKDFLVGEGKKKGVHEKYLTGKTKRIKNKWGEWEQEPMYSFDLGEVSRDWCTYTQLCNNFLMQAPAAMGAKNATVELIKKYEFDPNINILAFIHDEVVIEVKKDAPDKLKLVGDVADVLITEMQKVLSTVRIAAEADIMPYWMKEGGHTQITFWKNPHDDILYHKKS